MEAWNPVIAYEVGATLHAERVARAERLAWLYAELPQTHPNRKRLAALLTTMATWLTAS